MRIRTLTFASIAVMGMGVTFTATPAQAANEPRHCVVNASDANARVACYDSFAMAIARATGARITDAPDNARKATNDPSLDNRLNALPTTPDSRSAPQANVIIEIAYEGLGFGSSSLIFSADRTCTDTLDDIDFSAPYLDFTPGIRSYRNFAGCLSKHYELPGFAGRPVGWNGGKDWRSLTRHLGRRNTLEATIRAVAGRLSDHQHTDRRKPVAAITAGPAA